MIISAFRVINTVPKGKGKEAKEDKNMKEKTARQIEGMKAQTFGVEIEGNNITREKAARTAAEFFGTTTWSSCRGWSENFARQG